MPQTTINLKSMITTALNKIYYVSKNHLGQGAERRGSQLGQSVRLIIERPRAQVPPPARIIEITNPHYTAKINRYLCHLFFKS